MSHLKWQVDISEQSFITLKRCSEIELLLFRQKRGSNTFPCPSRQFFEPTCAYARWALMHCFLYGCDLTKIQTLIT